MIVAVREGSEEKTGYMLAIEHLQSFVSEYEANIGYGIADDFLI